MKTAVSIPDPIFAAGDELAARLGISRSELYARALADYVAKHRDQDVTERLNEIFATESNSDAFVRGAAARTLDKNEWS